MDIPLEIAAYLAGAMDSDGTIGIKRSTYHQRVRGDARCPVYSERIGLKHVTPQVPTLLRETFGGSLGVTNPSALRGRPLWSWQATDRRASECLSALLPHLRVKRAQAENALALRASKDRPRSEQRRRREEPTMSRNRWGMAKVYRWELAPEILEQRELLYLRAKALNRVGV